LYKVSAPVVSSAFHATVRKVSNSRLGQTFGNAATYLPAWFTDRSRYRLHELSPIGLEFLDKLQKELDTHIKLPQSQDNSAAHKHRNTEILFWERSDLIAYTQALLKEGIDTKKISYVKLADILQGIQAIKTKTRQI